MWKWSESGLKTWNLIYAKHWCIPNELQSWTKTTYPPRPPPLLFNDAKMALFSVFHSLGFVSTEKIFQTLKRVFHQLSKHLKFCQKYLTAHSLSNSLWIFQWNTWCLLCLIFYFQHTSLRFAIFSHNNRNT